MRGKTTPFAMFLLEAATAQYLRQTSHFNSGWHIREGFDSVERQTTPALGIRTIGAQPVSNAAAGVRIEVTLGIAIVVARDAQTLPTLDSAFAAVIANLHGLRLQDASGRHWSALQLTHIREAALVDGLGGVELHFTSNARFAGKPCD